ncbi:MAG: STAS domain-containing protein [Desulfuromonadales bacterium]|nr:STAS domain-containing protein [Desulfuromonadales bacterium]
MKNWSFDAESSSGTLIVEGDMTINHVADLKERLVEALVIAERLKIDVSSVTAIDVAGIQLLCSCYRFAVGCNKAMCLRLGGNATFLQFLDDLGFARNFICDHGNANECLWTVVN